MRLHPHLARVLFDRESPGRTARRRSTRTRRGCIPMLVPLEPRQLLAAGDLDHSFNPTGTPGLAVLDFAGGADTAESVAVQPDGKIVMGGEAVVSGETQFAVARYLPNGSLDHTFGAMSSGYTTTSITAAAYIHAIALQADGKIVAVGESLNSVTHHYDVTLARYLTNGTLDPTFGTGGVVVSSLSSVDDHAYAVGIQANSKIVVAGDAFRGADYDVAVARFNANGTLDSTFGIGGKVFTDFGALHDDHAYAMTLQPDGKIIVAGSVFGTSNPDLLVARYTTSGALDTGVLTGFGDVISVGGIFQRRGYVKTDVSTSDRANDVVAEPDGKVVVAGTFQNGAHVATVLARYSSVGGLDPTFNTGGLFRLTSSSGDISAVALTRQPDGKLIAAARATASLGGTNIELIRVTVDGHLDTSFRTNGLETLDVRTNDDPRAVTVTPTGRIIVVGSARPSMGDSDWFVCVLIRGDLTIGDYDGDGKTDPTVFEPSTSTFYIARSTLGNTAKQIGSGTSSGKNPIPVPADYDGDGLMEPAVFEPSTSTFIIAGLGMGNFTKQFGQGTLYGGHPIPVVADFDGDGKADVAVFEPSTSTFSISRSTLGNIAIQFGQGTLYGGNPIPIPADYDGDGKIDVAVFEPSTSTFYLSRSRLGNTAIQFGQGTLWGGHPQPVPADYDGDGLTDPAVFEPSTSTFYLARSKLGNTAIQFGQGTLWGGHPIPIPADYDGDTLTDPAVFEPTTSTFYLARSQLGNTAIQFGQGTLWGGHPITLPGDYDNDGIADPTVFEPSTSTFYIARSKLGNTAIQFGQGTLYGGSPIPLPKWWYA